MALSDRVITREGDLLVCVRNGSRSLIGKAALIDSEAAGSAFGAFMSVLRSNDGPFLRQVFDMALLKRQIEQGMGATINQITNRDMDALLVPWPSSAEERRLIGSVLVDADALIDSLEQLLTKNRQIKQGAMRELLTGKRRLPGFDRPWKASKLRQLGTFLKGSGIRRDEAFSGDLPCVRYGEIYTKHSDHIRNFSSWIAPEVACTSTLLRRGDLLFAGSGETKEEIGKCVAFLHNEPAYAGGDIVILRPTVEVDSMFLGYLFNMPSVARQKASRGQGDAVVHISANALSEIEVELPDAAEQAAIAQALADMDTEITALESRLSKARALKQAMAQALLTGRIRLVEKIAS